MFQSSFQIPQQLSSAGKSQLDAQLRLVHDYNRKALEGAESLLALHLDTSKAVLDKAAAATRQLLAAREPRDYLTLSAAHFGPSLEQLFAYGRQFFSIAAGSIARAPVPPVTAPPLVEIPPAPVLALAPPPAPAPVDEISEPAKTISQTTAEVVEESTSEVVEQATGAVDSAAQAVRESASAVVTPAPPDAPAAPEAAPEPAVAAPAPAVAEADQELAAAVLAPKVPATPGPAKPAAAASSEPKRRDTMTVKPATKVKK